jgi:hypothetical protein
VIDIIDFVDMFIRNNFQKYFYSFIATKITIIVFTMFTMNVFFFEKWSKNANFNRNSCKTVYKMIFISRLPLKLETKNRMCEIINW